MKPIVYIPNLTTPYQLGGPAEEGEQDEEA